MSRSRTEIEYNIFIHECRAVKWLDGYRWLDHGDRRLFDRERQTMLGGHLMNWQSLDAARADLKQLLADWNIGEDA